MKAEYKMKENTALLDIDINKLHQKNDVYQHSAIILKDFHCNTGNMFGTKW